MPPTVCDLPRHSPRAQQPDRRRTDANAGIRKLEEMGYALALFPLGTAFAAAKGMKEYLEVLATEGDTRGALQRMILFEEFNQLIGLDEHTDSRSATRSR